MKIERDINGTEWLFGEEEFTGMRPIRRARVIRVPLEVFENYKREVNFAGCLGALFVTYLFISLVLTSASLVILPEAFELSDQATFAICFALAIAFFVLPASYFIVDFFNVGPVFSRIKKRRQRILDESGVNLDSDSVGLPNCAYEPKIRFVLVPEQDE